MNTNRINIRGRIIFASIILSGLLFLFISPFLSFFLKLVNTSNDLKNITISKVEDNLTVSWELSPNDDVKQFKLYVNDAVIDLDNDIFQYDYNLKNAAQSEKYDVKLSYLDSLNREVFGLQRDVTDLIKGQVPNNVITVSNDTGSKPILEFEIVDNKSNIAIILAILSTAFCSWIFLFNFTKAKSLLLVLYVGLVTFSIVAFILNVIFNYSANFNNLILSVIVGVGFYILIYLLYLTVNILQNSLFYNLPLEQAAKASQFIFSLISTYLAFIIFFSTNYSLLRKTIAVLPFVFFFTYISLAMIKTLKDSQSLVRALSITLTIVFAIFVISIWAINYIYGILVIAVLYYILLSISLEVRQGTMTGKYVWLEYQTLIFLIFVLLLFTSNWGINGTLI